jgi:tubulin alpha
MTASLRFEGEMNVDLNEFQTNLVPFPRLHFMTSSMSPIQSRAKANNDDFTTQKVTNECFLPPNMLVKYTDFDPEADKYMAVSLNYRGKVISKEANATVQWLKNNKKLAFVEWCPTGFKIGLNDIPPAVLEVDDIAPAPLSAVMMGNNTGISRLFTDRISRKYDLMYSQRAFVHWYVGEGMEEGEFAEAREDLGFLEKDYLDVLSEQPTDDAQGGGDDGDEEY